MIDLSKLTPAQLAELPLSGAAIARELAAADVWLKPIAVDDRMEGADE